MADYRLKIKDTLQHVLLGIQQSLLVNVKSSSQMPLPEFVDFNPLSDDEKKKCGFLDKDGQNKSVLLLQLKMKAVDKMVIVQGAACQNWEEPDKSTGFAWMMFKLPVVKVEVDVLPARHANLQVVNININYVQRWVYDTEHKGFWCDYISRWPLGCQELGVKVPGWMKSPDFNFVIKKTIQYNKMVRIEGDKAKSLFTEEEKNNICLANADSNILRTLPDLSSTISNTNSKESESWLERNIDTTTRDDVRDEARNRDNVRKDGTYGDDIIHGRGHMNDMREKERHSYGLRETRKDEEMERNIRAQIRAEEQENSLRAQLRAKEREESLRAQIRAEEREKFLQEMKNIQLSDQKCNLERQNNPTLMDTKIPGFISDKDRDALLLPRSPLRSPPAVFRTQGPAISSASPPGPRLINSVRLRYPHLAGSELLRAAQDIKNCQKHSPRITATHPGVFPISGIKPLSPVLGVDHKTWGDVIQEPGYAKVCVPPEGFGHLGTQDGRESAGAGPPDNNEANIHRASLSSVSYPQFGSTETLEPDRQIEVNNQKGNETSLHRSALSPSEHSAPRTQHSTPTLNHQYESLDFHSALRHPPPGQDKSSVEEDDNTDWNDKSYLGPARGTGGDQIDMPRRLHTEMLELHELITSELSRVHRLEDQISLKVYGTKLKNPVSVLEDDEVMKAVQDPSKLAGNTRDKIIVMKEVLSLMQSAKQHHQQVLQQLASPVPADEQVDPVHEEEEMPRRSSRDKQPKRNSDFFYY